jgi:hypothetical protein
MRLYKDREFKHTPTFDPYFLQKIGIQRFDVHLERTHVFLCERSPWCSTYTTTILIPCLSWLPRVPARATPASSLASAVPLARLLELWYPSHSSWDGATRYHKHATSAYTVAGDHEQHAWGDAWTRDTNVWRPPPLLRANGCRLPATSTTSMTKVELAWGRTPLRQ